MTIIKKTWLLTTYPLEQDTIFLSGLGCDVQIHDEQPAEFFEISGKTYQFRGKKPNVFITTTCKKQEMMLQLKYGDELILQQVYHEILPTRTYFLGYEDINMVSHSR